MRVLSICEYLHQASCMLVIDFYFLGSLIFLPMFWSLFGRPFNWSTRVISNATTRGLSRTVSATDKTSYPNIGRIAPVPRSPRQLSTGLLSSCLPSSLGDSSGLTTGPPSSASEQTGRSQRSTRLFSLSQRCFNFCSSSPLSLSPFGSTSCAMEYLVNSLNS
jgi:hypothetical protein